jgi:hypothetical protein
LGFNKINQQLLLSILNPYNFNLTIKSYNYKKSTLIRGPVS